MTKAKPVPARTAHHHAECGHWCFGQTCRLLPEKERGSDQAIEPCRKCRINAFNASH